MDLRVIFGPACADTLKQHALAKLSELTESTFHETPCTVSNFADGEQLPQIGENIRGTDVYIIQPTPASSNNLVIMLQLLQAASYASAARVTAVFPYMGGLRQDRKDRPRVPITAALIAMKIEAAMVAAAQKHVMVLHPHFPQIQGIFRIANDLLYPTEIFERKTGMLLGNDFGNLVPCAPDAGSAKLAELYRRRFSTHSYAVGDKRRTKDDTVEIKRILGEIKDKIVVIFDDIADTFGSMAAISERADEEGAREIYGMVTHGVLAGKALKRLEQSRIKKLYITDSIRQRPEVITHERIDIVSVGGLIAEAIWRNNTNKSIHAIDGMFNDSVKES